MDALLTRWYRCQLFMRKRSSVSTKAAIDYEDATARIWIQRVCRTCTLQGRIRKTDASSRHQGAQLRTNRLNICVPAHQCVPYLLSGTIEPAKDDTVRFTSLLLTWSVDLLLPGLHERSRSVAPKPLPGMLTELAQQMKRGSTTAPKRPSTCRQRRWSPASAMGGLDELYNVTFQRPARDAARRQGVASCSAAGADLSSVEAGRSGKPAPKR
eukprot:6207900-Pleurochrysis_carterae.AAC.3